MTTILNSYEINKNTMAISHIAHTDYYAKVIEKDRELFIRQTPHKLIRSACLDHFASYEGRKSAVTHHFGFKRKIPIPINPDKQLFAFPTHALNNFACMWIFHNHVKAIQRALVSSSTATESSNVLFKNDQQMSVDASRYILETQMKRTSMCVEKFGSTNEPFPDNPSLV